VVDICESPPEFITPTEEVEVELLISQTHSFGRFPFGTTAVTYSARDSSGNTANCTIYITLQSK
jgi:hypothetical protein